MTPKTGKPLQKWITYIKDRGEIIRYIIAGGLTTAINYAVYALALLLVEGVPGDYQIVNAAAFIISAAFAFVANKYAVFRAPSANARETARQGGSFLLMRLVTYALGAGLLALLVDALGMHKLLAKVIENMMVIFLNYFISKGFIFRRPSAAGDTVQTPDTGDGA
jgi:putative flippase GtrA